MPQSLLLLNLSGRLVTPIRAALSSTPRTRNKTHISGIANRNSHSDPDPSSDILNMSIKANHAVNQPKPSLQSESVHVLSASGTGFANSKGTSTSLSNKSTSAKVTNLFQHSAGSEPKATSDTEPQAQHQEVGCTVPFGATTEFSVQETEGPKQTSRTNVHTSAIGENA